MGCSQSKPLTDPIASSSKVAPAPHSSAPSTESSTNPTPAPAPLPKSSTPPGVGDTYKALAGLYNVSKELGKGGFGDVKQATRVSDGKQVAIKVISKAKFSGEQEHQNMLTEVKLMKQVKGHRNVVEIFDYLEDDDYFYMIIEVCSGGELMDRILKEQQFSEKAASAYFRQMAEGLRHIHNNLVVHRDLKPENFLLESAKHDAQIKITDFGLSCPIKTPDSVITDACGSAYYIAPEVFTHRYTKAADVWALGVILYLLLSGTVPFGALAESEVEVYRCIQRDNLKFGKEWAQSTAAVRELISGLLEKDPSKRYTLDQAIAHPWVSGGSASDKPLDSSLISSLLSFNARNKFKRSALRLVSSALGAADVANLRAAFHRIDKDGSGFVTYPEMAVALRELGMAGAQDKLKVLMANLDLDGDGRISYDEFLLAVLERQLVHQQNVIWWAFCEYDIDGDGKITLDELRQAMKNENTEKLLKYIDEYDLDKDGTISYEEFMRMLLPKDMKFKITAS